jgi:ribosome biogenesis protein Nip4
MAKVTDSLQNEIKELADAKQVSPDTLLILKMMTKCTERLEKKVESEIEALKVNMEALDTSVKQNKSKIEKVEAALNSHKKAYELDKKLTRKLIRQTAQRTLDNDIILKGFPDSNFDFNEVMQNITSICNLQHGYNNSYKFSRNIGINKETQEPMIIHLMSLSFISKMDKDKVFAKMKAEGHFLLGDLLSTATEDNKLSQIWVEHKLSLENLAMRKRLLQIKRDGKIEGFVMRSGIFIIQQKDAAGNIFKLSISEMNQLNEYFPEPKNNSDNNTNPKRLREPNSSSPPTPHSKAYKAVSNSGAGSSTKLVKKKN